MGAKASSSTPPGRDFSFALVVLLVVLMMLAVGYGTRERLLSQARQQAEHTLAGLAKIRHAEVEHWLEDLHIKNNLPTGGTLSLSLADLARDRGRLSAVEDRLAWMVNRSYEFSAAWLLDPAGREIAGVGGGSAPGISPELLQRAARSGDMVVRDFYLDDSGAARLASVSSLLVDTPEGPALAGYLVIAIDPAYTLYPMLQRGFPVGVEMETFLARREGEAVRYLNPLAQGQAPLELRIEKPSGRLLALRPDEADGLVIEGVDYRDEPVLGVVHHVREMNWILVTKMDRDAVYAAAHGEFAGLALRLGGLGVMLVLLLWVVLRYLRVQSDFEQVSQDLARARREKQFDFLVHYAHDIVLLMDEQGNILEANEAASRAYGYARDELVGRNIAELRAPETLTSLSAQLAAAGSEQGVTFKTIHRRRSGEVFPVEVSSGSFEHQGRRYRQSIVRDISRREEAEARLRSALAEQIELNRRLEEAQNQLLQSEKMASIGQLAAGVAHEINNPVGFVSSNLGTLNQYLQDLLAVVAEFERRFGDDPGLHALMAERDMAYIREDAPALVSESLEGIARVRKIVQDLKDFSRVGESNWQWADLHGGLDSTINIVWNEIKYKATLERQYGDLPEIWCLPSQLNQVFLNLLVNAAHAIADKGVITVRTGCDADTVWVEVADTGRGIAPEHLGRLFDPFFTTKPVGQGTGLGLSLAFSIVRKHGGRIDVRSEPGQGAVFRVVLPRVPPEAPAPTEDANAPCKEQA